MLKKIVLSVLIATSPMTASAGIMANMNSMFMSNSTAATTITTQDRVGVFGGSFMMRTPVQSANIVSFDPPRLDAGCGGVDLYLGSFTFINSQQLVTLFRQVAANAVGLAFKAAIDAISPSLGKLLTEFQTLLQKMNNLAKNSCNMAHLLTDSADKAISSAVGGDAMTNNVVNQQISDWSAGLGAYLADPNSLINQGAHLNPKAGNGNAKVIIASGTSSILGTVGLGNADGSADNASDPNSLNNRVLLSLLGFEINAVSCSIDNQASTPNTSTATPGTGMTQNTCSGENTITLDTLVKGGGAGSASPDSQMLLWQCMNPLGSAAPGLNTHPQICTQMKKSVFNYVGIKGWVNTMLFGVGDTSAAAPDPASIVGLFNSGNSVTLNPQQIAFINQSGVPLIGLLTKTSNPNTRASIAARLEPHITSCISAKVGEALYKSSNGIKDVTGYTLTDDAKKNIEALRVDYLHQQDTCNSAQNVISVINQLVMATTLQANKIK
jgi:conjugative transfer pilus assembly protein TraH